MFENKAEKNHDNPTIKVVTDQEIEIGGSKSKQSRPPILPPSSADSEEDTSAVVFSSQKSQFADYTTWKGIENKTGIKREHAYDFVLKELLDNAVDYLETQHNRAAAAAAPPLEIHVTIKKIEPQEKLIRIVVSNSNYDTSISSSSSKATFSKQMLNSIFDFDRYHSSKRNEFKITKGALGDALKEVLCIPHVLAHDNEINNWDYPLKIYAAQKVFQVYLAIDRINQLIHARIDDDAEVTYYDDTKIEVTLPVVDGQNKDDLITRLSNYLCNYAIFATHIGFSFEDESNQEEIFIEFPQLQTINPKWKNHSSIHYYKRKQFHDFILGLENNDWQAYSVLYKTFREASNMPKTELTQMTIGQLKHSPAHIDRLYDELRNSMSAPTALTLPFDVTKKGARAQALKQRVEQRYGHFSEMKYRSASGTYVESGGDQFPFFFEIAIFHDVQYLRSNLAFRQALNCSAIPNTGWTVFGGDELFEWVTPGSKFTYTSNSIQDIFRHYGYSYDNKKCKKPRSLIIANLISPKIDYQSYGKSRIDFRPFADVVAKTTVLACMGGGRASDGKPSKKAVLLEVLEKRKQKWEAMDAVSRLKHWWTQSDVFYATRKLLIEYHYTNEEIDRDYITGLIKEICEDELYVKREDIGILAADRAQLYFKGRWMDVGLKEIEELSLYGVDMLIIEKEGIAEQLALFADQKGIALLNTRGFLTEYAEVLSKKSDKEGCNIAILTDFDVSGLILATKVPGAYRIGIDFETLDDLGLDIEGVEEEYKPRANHLKPLQEGGELANMYPQDWVDYVEDRRVEINSVVTELDDNAKFWEWIVQKLRDRFDTRNYNRAVDVPEYVMPKCLESLNEKVKEKGIAILKEQRLKLQNRLSDIGPGFLFDRTDRVLLKKRGKFMTISKYEQTLTDQSRHIIQSDEIMKTILDKIQDWITNYL